MQYGPAGFVSNCWNFKQIQALRPKVLCGPVGKGRVAAQHT